MSTNKKISSRSRSKTVSSMLNSPAPAAKPKSLKEKTKELQNKVHRLEVEIASTSRLATERRQRYRDTLPPPEKSGFARSKQQRLTHAQKREQNQRLMIKVVEFAVMALLVAGGLAWLYQTWVARSAS